mmetsp:Transcript_19697/g.43690  ORF Transcript_19697/g.43690 Transcript_19697/m.43690 type:complete len:292 (+) Transcript_19697:338-1213(+)
MQNGREHVHGEVPWGQRNPHSESHRPQHVHTLTIGRQSWGKDHRPVHTNTVSSSLHSSHHLIVGLALHVHESVALQGVQRVVPLILAEIHGNHTQTHRLRILAAHMPQSAAGAHDRNPLPGLRLGLLQRFVGGHTSAQDRSSLSEAHFLRDSSNVRRLSDGVLCEATVCNKASLMLLPTNGLPTGKAIVAAPAGVVQPSVPHTVPDLQILHAITQLHNHTSALVARNNRQGRLHTPVTITHMQIRVAHTRSDHLDQHLPGTRLRDGHGLHRHGFVKLLDHRSLHRGWNRHG